MGGNFYDPYCGMHSWPYSNEYPYKQCCYERDGMECMWYKPDELGNSEALEDKHYLAKFLYSGYSVGGLGFEITCWTEGTITEDFAMDCWRRSSYHMDVILTRGQWSNLAQFGCYIDYSFANCWFAY